jgi:hypothetical protein
MVRSRAMDDKALMRYLETLIRSVARPTSPTAGSRRSGRRSKIPNECTFLDMFKARARR